MTQSRALFPGPQMDAFFRAILRTEPRLDDDAVDRLTRDCARPVARMWVTDLPTAAPVRAPSAETVPPRDNPEPAVQPQVQPAAHDDVPWAQDLAAGHERALEEMAPWPEEQTAAAAPPSPPFDPYAFSVAALLKREGPEGLRARLSAISAAADLLALAEAQHLSLPDGLTAADAIRDAMIASAEARLAGRRAAAS